MDYDEASSRPITANGGQRRWGHGDGTQWWNTGDVARGEAAHLWLGWLSENVAEVREVLVELWLEWCWLWCSGELVRARRSNGDGGGPLRCCAEAKEKAKK